ncbi:MAG: hypothetical protein ACRCSV_04415, partial [Chlamydiales bacterium]
RLIQLYSLPKISNKSIDNSILLCAHSPHKTLDILERLIQLYSLPKISNKSIDNSILLCAHSPHKTLDILERLIQLDSLPKISNKSIDNSILLCTHSPHKTLDILERLIQLYSLPKISNKSIDRIIKVSEKIHIVQLMNVIDRLTLSFSTGEHITGFIQKNMSMEYITEFLNFYDAVKQHNNFESILNCIGEIINFLEEENARITVLRTFTIEAALLDSNLVEYFAYTIQKSVPKFVRNNTIITSTIQETGRKIFSEYVGNKGFKFHVSLSVFHNNPITIFLSLFYKMKQYPDSMFFQIQYLNSLGQDVGGVTRDFISRLVSTIYKESYQLYRSFNTGIIPIINDKNSNLSVDDQKKYFIVFGKLFFLSFLNHQSVTLGKHFHPSVFEMIFSLNDRDLKNIFSDEVFKKMVKIYGIKVFQLSEEAANDLSQNIMNESIQDIFCVDSIKELKDTYMYDKQINAILIIAKSMYDSLKIKFPKNRLWNSLKEGSSAEKLQIKIEGEINLSKVLDALRYKGNFFENNFIYMKRWCTEANTDMLKKLVYATTGKDTLNDKDTINVTDERTDGKLPYFCTCFSYIQLSNYSGNYEKFKKDINTTIESIACQREEGTDTFQSS